MIADPAFTPAFWGQITRLGEAQILMPVALATAAALWRQDGGRVLARSWLAALTVAAAITTASKLAYIGWGLGAAALDFTGISGHAMFAAAVYPWLFAAFAPPLPRAARPLALLAGGALALVVGWSRLPTGAHSGSEVIAGLLLGGAASLWVLWRLRGAPVLRLSPWLPAVAALWLAWMPLQAPPSRTHSMVTWLALKLAGRDRPYTRADLRHGPARGNRQTQVTQGAAGGPRT